MGWTAGVWWAVETVQEASGWLCGGRVRTTEAVGLGGWDGSRCWWGDRLAGSVGKQVGGWTKWRVVRNRD